MKRLCLEPRCPNPATYRGRCSTHAKQNERATHPNKRFYNSVRWKYARRKQLYDHPVCNRCGRLAIDIDHRIPIERGGAPYAPANLQSLCKHCHGQKTRKEQA